MLIDNLETMQILRDNDAHHFFGHVMSHNLVVEAIASIIEEGMMYYVDYDLQATILRLLLSLDRSVFCNPPLPHGC